VSLDIAVCDILEKRSGVYFSFPMELFESILKTSFLEHYERLLVFGEKKSKETGIVGSPIITSLYNMRVSVDYILTVVRLKEIKLNLEKMEKEKENITLV
jgi:hypothetical protein